MASTKIRMLTISNMYPSKGHPSFGIFVKKFEDALERQGFYISGKSVIRGQGKGTLEKLFKYIVFYCSVAGEVFKKKHDIIYIHYISNVSPVLYFLKTFFKKPVVINFHGGDLLPKKGIELYTDFFTRKLVDYAELIVVPSDYFKNIVLEKYRISTDKIYVYPSVGIDVTIFKPLERIALRAKLNLSGFLIGYVSRITHRKGWDTYLKALKRMDTMYPSSSFKGIVVGIGEQVNEFKNMIIDLELKHRILYLGEKSNSDLPDVYNLLDVFVFPSQSDTESLGLVGLEALACGVPVIGSEMGGIPGFVKAGYNGFLFEPGSDIDLFEKLKSFYLLNPEQILGFKDNAIRSIENFESESVTKKIAIELSSIVRNSYERAKH